MYQLGLVSISFRALSPRQICEYVKAAKLSCIEWGSDVHAPCDDPARLKEIVSLQQEFGISCCSYGTYFHLGSTPTETLPAYIAAAKVLGTRVLRLWCGDHATATYSEEERAALLAACREAAAIAEAEDVVLCLECHNHTFTEDPEDTLWLMEQVNSPHFRMYWQPNQFRPLEENLRYAQLLAPYTYTLHVFNWWEQERYPLREAAELWKQYLSFFPKDRTLLLEFMPDDRPESLSGEAAALFAIAGGV